MSVREGLLALLADGPRNGHQLKVEFEAATAGVWPRNVGQVVRSYCDGDGWTGGKRYELTAAGREALAAWWELVPADEPPPRDELMLKVLFAATLGVERAVAVLTEQRTALVAHLQRRRREQRAETSDDVVAAIVRDALVVRAEADLRWLDLCEARLTARKGTSR